MSIPSPRIRGSPRPGPASRTMPAASSSAPSTQTRGPPPNPTPPQRTRRVSATSLSKPSHIHADVMPARASATFPNHPVLGSGPSPRPCGRRYLDCSAAAPVAPPVEVQDEIDLPPVSAAMIMTCGNPLVAGPTTRSGGAGGAAGHAGSAAAGVVSTGGENTGGNSDPTPSTSAVTGGGAGGSAGGGDGGDGQPPKRPTAEDNTPKTPPRKRKREEEGAKGRSPAKLDGIRFQEITPEDLKFITPVVALSNKERKNADDAEARRKEATARETDKEATARETDKEATARETDKEATARETDEESTAREKEVTARENEDDEEDEEPLATSRWWPEKLKCNEECHCNSLRRQELGERLIESPAEHQRQLLQGRQFDTVLDAIQANKNELVSLNRKFSTMQANWSLAAECAESPTGVFDDDEAKLGLPYTSYEDFEEALKVPAKRQRMWRIMLHLDFDDFPNECMDTFFVEDLCHKVHPSMPPGHGTRHYILWLGERYHCLPRSITRFFGTFMIDHVKSINKKDITDGNDAKAAWTEHFHSTRTKMRHKTEKLFANAEGDPMMVMLWRDTKSGVRVVDEPAPLHGSQEEKDQYLDRWNAKVEAKLAEFFPNGYSHPTMPEVGSDDDTCVRRKKKKAKKAKKKTKKSVAVNLEDGGGLKD